MTQPNVHFENQNMAMADFERKCCCWLQKRQVWLAMGEPLQREEASISIQLLPRCDRGICRVSTGGTCRSGKHHIVRSCCRKSPLLVHMVLLLCVLQAPIGHHDLTILHTHARMRFGELWFHRFHRKPCWFQKLCSSLGESRDSRDSPTILQIPLGVLREWPSRYDVWVFMS